MAILSVARMTSVSALLGRGVLCGAVLHNGEQ